MQTRSETTEQTNTRRNVSLHFSAFVVWQAAAVGHKYKPQQDKCIVNTVITSQSLPDSHVCLSVIKGQEGVDELP